MSDFRLRREQQDVIDGYQGGYAAISAVPGAGKTTTLSALAAHLIEQISPRQRVVVVTYQNAAVANFQRAIIEQLQERGMPERGFMVRTLHSLAFEVLSSARHRAELDIAARVIDDVDAKKLMDDAIHEALESNRDSLLSLLVDQNAPDARRWPDGDTWLLGRVAEKALEEMRRIERDIESFGRRCEGYGRWLPFVLDACARYQLALKERGYYDYDGIVERAVETLEREPTLCQRLQARWPYLLEDEAQDSTPLLERMLTLVAGENGNLIRVGDPNQSIMTTFTSSSVDGFLRWIDSSGIQQFRLAGSSRSTEVILELANRFVDRVHMEFPIEESRLTALRRQPILPVRDGVTLLNPPVPRNASLGLQVTQFHRTEDERAAVLDKAIGHLRKFPDQTVAILVGSKETGYEYAANAARYLPDDKIIRLLSGKDGRQIGLISNLLQVLDFLENPDQGHLLNKMLDAWSSPEGQDRVAAAVREYIRSYKAGLIDLLFPKSSEPVGSVLTLPANLSDDEKRTLARLQAVPGWLEIRLAQPHELLSYVRSTIGLDDTERQLLDVIISTIVTLPPDPKVSRLGQLRSMLKLLQDRQRKLRGTHDDYEIRIDPGTLTISTRHQAKGLEWDIVFAVGCDDFWFRGALGTGPRYPRPHLGLFDQLLVMKAEIGFAAQGMADYPDDDTLRHATFLQECAEASEGLRVMYVTITRARQGLWLSWHRDGLQNGRRQSRTMSPIFPILAQLVEEVREGRVSVAAD